MLRIHDNFVPKWRQMRLSCQLHEYCNLVTSQDRCFIGSIKSKYQRTTFTKVPFPLFSWPCIRYPYMCWKHNEGGFVLSRDENAISHHLLKRSLIKKYYRILHPPLSSTTLESQIHKHVEINNHGSFTAYIKTSKLYQPLFMSIKKLSSNTQYGLIL